MNTNSSLTSNSWLKAAQRQLEAAGIATARLDCLVLLQDALGQDKSYILARPETVLGAGDVKLLNRQLKRRVAHEPLAYIRGKSEFYGREFLVTANTLEPRPETEAMIDLLKDVASTSQFSCLLQDSPITDGGFVITDVGTGSGCLAITAKAEFPDANVIATDISPACITIARHNAKRLGTDVTFFQGDLLAATPHTAYRMPYILLANLPYVPDAHTINAAAMFEPKLAIFGGADGLGLYRRLFEQIAARPQKPQYVLTESLPFQHQKLENIAQAVGYTQLLSSDFVQIFTSENA